MNEETKNGALVAAPGGAVALPEDIATRLAAYAKETSKAEVADGQFFSTKAGQLSFNKLPLPGNCMDVVILRSMFENVHYPEAYNPGKIESPLCFAFSHTGVGMVPHDMATAPQAGDCASCAHSKFALDPRDNKRRTACKDTRRLSCMPADATSDASKIAGATVGYLRVPVTSVKYWSAYVQKLALSNMPPFAVVTRVTLKPDPNTQVRFEFEHVRSITDPDVLGALFNRHDAEANIMSFPYQKRAEAPAPTASPPLPPAPGKF